MSTIKVAVGGFSSEVGKTTLLCELLRAFPGWEAIKMTRGHYRSCGKDPHACCVSHLLGDEPLIRSGRAQTFAAGKDTGRYWDAGASNVHWVIVTDNQVEQGIKLALERVQAAGVLIEGNSFLKFIDADFAIMVARAEGCKIKASARHVLPKSSALYLFEAEGDAPLSRASALQLGAKALPTRSSLALYPFTRATRFLNSSHVSVRFIRHSPPDDIISARSVERLASLSV